MPSSEKLRREIVPGMLVRIRPFDEYPEHTFEVTDVYDDCVCGYSRSGPLAGEYGEPEYDLILRILD